MLSISYLYKGKDFSPKSSIFREEGLDAAIKRNYSSIFSDCTMVPIFLVLLVFSFIITSCYGETRSSKKYTVVTHSALESLPIIDYERLKDLPGEEIICAICLEEFGSGQNLRVMTPCNHVYHSICIIYIKLKYRH